MNVDGVPDPVLAVRAGPGVFLLAAEHVDQGDEFTVDGARYVVASAPVPIGAGKFIATVTTPAGGSLSAQLQVGRKVS